MSMERNWLVLVGGGHAAGKKVVVADVTKNLVSLADDDFPMKVEVVHLRDYAQQGVYAPSSVDFERLRADLGKINEKHKQTVVIVEGLYALYDKELREKAIMKAFVDGDADTRLSRWILRDIGEDQSKLGDILSTYLNHARPEMNEFIHPTKQFADVILPRGSETSGVKLISTGIYERIKEEAMNLTSEHPLLLDTPKIDLRKESFVEQNQQFYDLN
jgi:uridine kinase